MQRPYRGPRYVGTGLVIFLRRNLAAGGEADNDVDPHGPLTPVQSLTK
jgi:hypothetical protein